MFIAVVRVHSTSIQSKQCQRRAQGFFPRREIVGQKVHLSTVVEDAPTDEHTGPRGTRCLQPHNSSSFVKSHSNENVKDSPVKAHRTLEGLLTAVRTCRACDAHLPLGARPVLQAGATARILVVGQAPGARVHASGVPWDDKSGERLREWMGIDSETFYDKARIAILPMGYCYPGRAASGDLPPRRECAEL